MTFPFVLKACSAAGAVEEGKQVHGLASKFEMGCDTFVQNGLINLYTKSGLLRDAVKVFHRMPQRDIVSWNTVIGGFVGLGMMDEARELFDVMPERNMASWNCLIDGYVKHGSMDIAQGLFERMPVKDRITWNTMIGGYASYGHLEEACKLFRKMPMELKDLVTVKVMIDGCSRGSRFEQVLKLFNEMLGLEIRPDNFTLVGTLTACSQLMALEQGEWVHSYIDRYNIRLDAVLGTALLELYAKCGNIEKALDVFSHMDEKDISAWNSIISNLGINGKGEQALEFFSKLLETSIEPDEVTFLSVLSACRHSDEQRVWYST
ncbi:pentatricopeptide repeat-containing protein At3g29230-like [Asparagus officinalis]|uniref:pentatricopeptide repeat-containing protein At3g29230-like n=1 Tax=Asparagus officinalis TaxID=4686 RepID=UPI00098E5221|nr:pentatricopeptide repeat-containing protein At3g29230-like [Asparagus officinalis]